MFNFSTNNKQRQPSLPTAPGGTQPQQMTQGTAAPKGSPMQQPTPTPQPMQNENDPYIQQRIEEIERQRIAFQRQNPDFNMKAEMQNPDFVNYVWGKELTVEEAYFLVHRYELLEQAKSEALEELHTQRSRITENGAAKNRPAIAKKNPQDLSDKEVDAIIDRARRGEKITF